MTGSSAEPTGEESIATLRERRRAQRQVERREDILTIAEELYAANGFERTSMDLLATGLGYSVGALYNFFPSKDELYAALLERQARAYSERLLACLERTTARPAPGMETLLIVIAAAVAMVEEYPPYLQAMNGLAFPSARDKRQRLNMGTILRVYATAIEIGQADGSVRLGNPRQLAQYVGSLVLGHVLSPGAFDPAGVLPVETFLDIVRAALAPVVGGVPGGPERP